GIAVGTVLVPEMTQRLALGDDIGARAAQNRAIEFALLLALPCVAAFLTVPGLIMRALFMRGAFTAADADAAALTLVAYTIGLVPFILIRSIVAPFFARGDTATPVKAALIGTGVNILFQIALMFPLAEVGLALATSIGGWLNFVLVLYFAFRARFIAPDAELKLSLIKLAAAALALALALAVAAPFVTSLLSSLSKFRDESELAVLMVFGGVVYGGVVITPFGPPPLSPVRRGAPGGPTGTLAPPGPVAPPP